jgi:O-antigen/teichoic acid export membrane protein
MVARFKALIYISQMNRKFLHEKIKYLKSPPPGLSNQAFRSHERYRRVVWSSISATISRVLAAMIGVASAPLILGYLGRDMFGLWMLVISLVAWMQLAEFGVANGLTNALSESYGRDDFEGASGYLSTTLVATIGLTLLLFPILYITSLMLQRDQFFKISDVGFDGIIGKTFFLLGSIFLINMIISISGRWYLATQRGYIYYFVQSLGSIFGFVGLWWGVLEKLDFIWLIGIVSGIPVLTNVFLWLDLIYSHNHISISLKNVKKIYFYRVANSSVPMFLYQVGSVLLNQSINIVVVSVAGLALVADFNIIWRVYLFAFTLAAIVGNSFYAAIREAFERGEIAWAKRAFYQSLIFRLVVLVPFIVVFLCYGDSLIQLWIGKFMTDSIGILGWMCVSIAMIFSSINSFLSEVLIALDEIWYQIPIVFINALIILAFIYFYTNLFGVPAIFISFIFSSIIAIIFLSKRLRKFSRR